MAARQWTDEQRQAQAEKIKTYQPWRMSTGATSEAGKNTVSQNALKTGEYTADKVKERKRKAANKRPLYKGGAVFETYGDKRFKWDRSSKYRGAFGCARYAATREKLKSLI